MRVTALLGAGAGFEVGGATTKGLTKAVRSALVPKYDRVTQRVAQLPFLDEIGSRLDQYFSPEKGNFEHMLHGIETLISHVSSLRSSTVAEYKPVLGAFMTDAASSIATKWLDMDLLIGARAELIKTVGREIIATMQGFDPSGLHSWFSGFWRLASSKCPLDIATFNYEDFVERSLGAGAYEDGYVDTGDGYSRLSARMLRECLNNRVLHLHGSVFYGYPIFKDPNAHTLEDSFEDLYKLPTPEKAMETWIGKSDFRTQSHEQIVVGPVITGLRKADKLLFHPYDAYLSEFRRALELSPRLLVAGYGFGDLHVNNLLNRMHRWHGSSRRIVVITGSRDPDKWHHDVGFMQETTGWPSFEVLEFVSRAFQEYRPFEPYTQFQSPIVSQDGACLLFLRGMHDAFTNHGTRIIQFLTS